MTESSTHVAARAEQAPLQSDAFVDGVNIDAIARAVKACADVAELSGGRFGEVASYLPGRRVPGVSVQPDVVELHVKARWGASAGDLYAQVSSVLAPLIDRRLDVVVADIDDPPSERSPAPLALEASDPATVPTPVTPVRAELSTEVEPLAGDRGISPIAL